MVTQTFSSDEDWSVPTGLQEVTIRLYGAAGRDGPSGYQGDPGIGGKGGYVEGTLDVSSTSTLYVRVNSDGGVGDENSDGSRPNNGGGSSDVRVGGTGLNDRVAVAAGGGAGGAGEYDDFGDGGDGGDGGANTGEDGSPSDSYDYIGEGGTQTSGGSGGFAENGGFGYGGDGRDNGGSAGGGGGWYGGGGGYGPEPAPGAGGGSNYTGGLDFVAANQRGASPYDYGDHRVEIEYTEPPAPPENTQQSINGDDEIVVTYNEDSSGGSADEFEVEVGEDGGNYTPVTTTTSTSVTYSADPQTNTHRFRVRASNSAGTSNWSYTATIATDPTGLSVTGTAQSEISLAWDGVRDAAGYEVLLAESSGGAASDYSSEATPAAAPYTITGLEDGERYYARVRATYSGADSQLTNEVDATTPLPAPTLDSLDAGTPQEITIPYTLEDDSTDGDVLIERSADGGATWSKIATVTDLSTTAYTDTGLLDGQEYTYRLTRRTDHAETTSATVSAITILPAPTNLTAPTIGDTSVEYAWDATHNQGQTRVEYRRAGEGDDWTTYETVDHETEAATVDGLLTGEQYEGRVVAQTDFAETEDE